MKQLQIKDVQGYFPAQLAFWSFLIGSLFLLLAFLFPKEEDILISGLIYVLLAFFLNGICFVVLLLQVVFNWKEREEIAFQMLILLANIPIAALYLFVLIQFKN